MEQFILLLRVIIWSVLTVVAIVVFWEKLNGLYELATKEGRSLEIGGWVKIGEQVKQTDIKNSLLMICPSMP
ncbi:MAG: hypothetical protein ACJAUV_000839 [Flavobacteriales bacterium]|jgi:hypothetical protein